MRVVFRVDATDRIGGGHVMRCLSLADELGARGAEIRFVSGAVTTPLRKRIEQSGHSLALISPPPGLDRYHDDWHDPPLPSDAQIADAEATLAAAGGRADWLVVDHYLLDGEWHRRFRRPGRQLLVIDDLANRALDCDVVLDETFGRAASDYRPLVPPGTTILTGAAYALLRREFGIERPAALKRRQKGHPATRVLVSVGTTDLGGVTAAVVESIIAAAPGLEIDVVLNEDAPSFPRVMALAKERKGVTVHVNTTRMAELMRDADIGVGAAGTSAWERCCMGLPSATLVLAGNQRGVAAGLEKVGASLIIADPSEAGAAVASLAGDPKRLAAMSANAFAVTNGAGACRIAQELFRTAVGVATVRA